MTADMSNRLLSRSLVVCVAWILMFNLLNAQQKDTSQVKDSLKVYKKIKKFAYRHKLTAKAYDAIFVEPKPIEYPKQPGSKEEKIVNPYLKYQDKIVRNINIKVYDPFGYSVADTVQRKITSLERLGNRAHTTTRQWVIFNKLLFNKNEPVNAIELSETERVLREAAYVNDVNIYITPSESKDSVDVNVVVLDKWPITIPVLITDVFVNAKFRNYNLFGVGQRFEQFAEIRRPEALDFYGSYGIDNIDNTYISSSLYYQTNKNITQTSLSFDRGFYSPLAKWAGGAYISKAWSFYDYNDTVDGTPKRTNLDNIAYDLWAAKSFKLSKDSSFFNQSTNLIVGARYYANEYQRRPSSLIDPNKTILNSYSVLGNVGLAVQQYYKDKYIYRFGANEDVPEGLIIQYTYGTLKIEQKKLRYYSGIEVARAKHLKFGYLSATFSYGVFFNQQVPNDVTVKYNLYYFSDLLKKGRWYFRQFIKYDLVHGENKISNDQTSFTSDDLYGFNSNGLSGKTKMVLNSETVAYLPYNVIGFRFAPVISAGFGMIGSPDHPVLQSNLYQAYSVGLMVRNENLLSSTFQVSFGLYPFLPNGGNYIFKYNPIGSFTLRVRAFSVSKPQFITY